jgi:catechol 2,3-dioxygenase-like lactoylglutathione lyase family enzyme
MLNKIDHIDIMVPDGPRFVSFLKDIGFEEIHRANAGRPQVELAIPGAQQVVLEVHESADVDAVTIAHIAVSTDDVRQAATKLQEKGIEFTSEPRVTNSGRLLCNFNDEWGMKWQLTSDLDEVAPQTV